ncbi:MAG: hypothetical protein ACR2J7_05960 [Luteimonas sp.]
MKLTMLASVAVVALLLTGCEATEWELSGSCEGGSGSWKCEAEGKIKGTFQKNSASTNSVGGMDAADFSIDVDGSSVVVPSTGNVTVSLVDSTTNAVQAAQAFAWVRSGSRLYLANPAQVNSWAQANSGTADTVQYQLHEFNVSGVTSGTNVFSVTAEYAGNPRASSISTFSGGGGECEIGYCQEQ